MRASLPAAARAGATLHVAAEGLEYGAADVGAPVLVETLLRNREIALHLTLQHLADFREIGLLRIREDALQIHVVARCLVHIALDRARCLILFEFLFIAENVADVGVLLLDDDFRRVIVTEDLCRDIEVRRMFRKEHFAEARCRKLARLFARAVRHIRNDLELLLRVAADKAQNTRDRNSFLTARVRHRDRLYILDDVAGAAELHAARLLAEHFARDRSRVRNRNRLGAAHGRNQFFPQNGCVTVLFLLLQFTHAFVSFSDSISACSSVKNSQRSMRSRSFSSTSSRSASSAVRR